MNSHCIRTYTELSALLTLEERFNYLKVPGQVGDDLCGTLRYLNQKFYHSAEWRRIRDQIIVRDQGCELGLAGFPIVGHIYIHHMNPISVEDIIDYDPVKILRPEVLICCSFDMHQMVHYGTFRDQYKGPVERTPNDTCPWKR